MDRTGCDFRTESPCALHIIQCVVCMRSCACVLLSRSPSSGQRRASSRGERIGAHSYYIRAKVDSNAVSLLYYISSGIALNHVGKLVFERLMTRAEPLSRVCYIDRTTGDDGNPGAGIIAYLVALF